MTNEMQEQIDSLQAQLDKLNRRQQRNMRNAGAKGMLQGICSVLKAGDVVFDCGANVGDVTGPLSETGALVHAFEPDPFAYKKLVRKFSNVENIVLHNVAVGVRKGSVTLMRASNFDDNPRHGSVKSTIVEGGRDINEEQGLGIDVELISLPDFIRKTVDEHGEIAFLKMDIEGAELDLLEHMEEGNLFEDIRLTVAETHENKFKALRPRFKALRERVEAAYPITKVNLDWI